MCGIFGAYSTKGRVTINEKELKILTDTMLHRGPDGSGYVVASNFAFGHRRLSIIDLSEKGQQPMYDKDRTVCIVFNGEIYNFQEIREELLELGFLFDSNTDTEVILYSYKAWGMDCVKKFNGMFAFVLYDKKEKTFLLARDRYGIKPLY
ncbi:MAG: asparagine synthetase B, partial [Candidatus Magasanikbacteria bacterium]|nr:asparagine synthetase B [Candidatus Magasanikbacteria bacterium]